MRDPYFACDGATLYLGDCVEVMAEMEAESVHAIVCDPPYDLTAGKKGGTGEASVNLDSPYGRARIGTGNGTGGFMGKAWDATGVAFDPETWRLALRVLKPGGHLLAFGGARTYHRMACAIEDAGFEIRDAIQWLYAQGFPKSLDVAKQIDKAAGHWRGRAGEVTSENGSMENPNRERSDKGVPITDEAKQWEGWGTALKPAYEPIVVARKPLVGTVAENVLEHGTGALNIDGCRIGFASAADEEESKAKNRHADFGTAPGGNEVYGDYSMVESKNYEASGRWPANVILSHAPGCEVLGTVGERVGGGEQATSGFVEGYERGDGFVGREVMSEVYRCVDGCPVVELDRQSGGGARFFYVGKAAPGERHRGLGEGQQRDESRGRDVPGGNNPRNRGAKAVANFHPTVKPLDLMQYLVRLVTPPDGVVLDCFAGSGTTLIAARERPGVKAIGIEREADYCELARRRLSGTDVQISLL